MWTLLNRNLHHLQDIVTFIYIKLYGYLQEQKAATRAKDSNFRGAWSQIWQEFHNISAKINVIGHFDNVVMSS